MLDWLNALESSTVITILAGFVAGLIVAYLGRIRDRRLWEQRHALHLLNVSVNLFEDGCLKIRTIFERPLEHIVINQHARDLLVAASRKATAEAPLIVLSGEYHSFIMNYVLNATAERFCVGTLRADIGQPANTARYVIFLTAEPATRERQRKFRAMLLKKELADAFPYDNDMPQLESPNHADRVRTLRIATSVYKATPQLFPVIELTV